MKIFSGVAVGLVLATSLVSAQESAPVRIIRPGINPAVTAQAVREPAAVSTLQGDADAKLKTLVDQVAALQAQNADLKTKLGQLQSKVDANQWNQTAAMANLQQSFKQHTHTYDRTFVTFKNVRIDDDYVSYISAVKLSPTTSSPPSE